MWKWNDGGDRFISRKKYVDFPFYGEVVLNKQDKSFQRINDEFW